MKTIELKDEECWFIEIYENTERTRYVFSEKVYTNLTALTILLGCSVDYPVFEGMELNAPNLQEIAICETFDAIIPFFAGIKLNVPKLRRIGIEGMGSGNSFQTLHQNLVSHPPLEEIWLKNTGITQIPEFILTTKTLKRLTLRNQNLTELPDDLFALENLDQLRLQYCTKITMISDEIKRLVNLEVFDLWQDHLKYLSPELFLLPKLKTVNFFPTWYTPTKEVLDTYETFKERNKNRPYIMPWEEH